MVTCARCSRDVDDVQIVTPDIMTKELMESIDHDEEEPGGQKSSMEVCAECMDELTGE